MVSGAEMATFWGMVGVTAFMAVLAYSNWRLCLEERQNRRETEIEMLTELRRCNAQKEEAEQRNHELSKQLKLLRSTRSESIRDAIEEGRAIERKAIEAEQEEANRERQKASIAETCGKAKRRKAVAE